MRSGAAWPAVAAALLATTIAAAGAEVGRPRAPAAGAAGKRDRRRGERSERKPMQQSTPINDPFVHRTTLFRREDGRA